MKKNYTVGFAILVVLGLSQCMHSEPKTPLEDIQVTDFSINMFNKLETNCLTCHTPKGSPEERVAPPLECVKHFYKDATETEDEFVEIMTSFVLKPNEEKVKMKGPMKKFGLMPVMNYTEDQLNAIARFIYNSEVHNSAWYEAHRKYAKENESELSNNDRDYKEKGANLAMSTKAVLGKNLMQAINTKGVENAVAFCNTKAIQLTDSMSMELNAKIRRVSDKNRNPNNQANQEELDYITKVKTMLSQEEKIPSKLIDLGDKYVGYYPIITNNMCLKCHGSGDQISPAVTQKLNTLYPEDKAIGYGSNELRGIWVVEMDKLGS
jgi:nitrate reductase cytochrome c-type subunit